MVVRRDSRQSGKGSPTTPERVALTIATRHWPWDVDAASYLAMINIGGPPSELPPSVLPPTIADRRARERGLLFSTSRGYPVAGISLKGTIMPGRIESLAIGSRREESAMRSEKLTVRLLATVTSVVLVVASVVLLNGAFAKARTGAAVREYMAPVPPRAQASRTSTTPAAQSPSSVEESVGSRPAHPRADSAGAAERRLRPGRT